MFSLYTNDHGGKRFQINLQVKRNRVLKDHKQGISIPSLPFRVNWTSLGHKKYEVISLVRTPYSAHGAHCQHW